MIKGKKQEIIYYLHGGIGGLFCLIDWRLSIKEILTAKCVKFAKNFFCLACLAALAVYFVLLKEDEAQKKF